MLVRCYEPIEFPGVGVNIENDSFSSRHFVEGDAKIRQLSYIHKTIIDKLKVHVATLEIRCHVKSGNSGTKLSRQETTVERSPAAAELGAS